MLDAVIGKSCEASKAFPLPLPSAFAEIDLRILKSDALFGSGIRDGECRFGAFPSASEFDTDAGIGLKGYLADTLRL